MKVIIIIALLLIALMDIMLMQSLGAYNKNKEELTKDTDRCPRK